VLRNQWAVRVPAGGSRSEPQELTWKIPERTPESYFFLLLGLMDAGQDGKTEILAESLPLSFESN
jgi:hypothetical protein